MREKELRLALVCYGGISLAVYMHGISKEIWRMARASRAFHDGEEPELGSQGVYRQLLTEIEEVTGTRMRVLVDIISGASAGALNGIFLAQAIATGQSLEPLTDLWLDSADVTALIDPGQAPQSRFTKAWALPLACLAANRSGDRIDETVEPAARDEVRAKLSHFVRSRWFEPPFGGELFTNMILDALDAMAAGPRGPRLLPDGQPLDLSVTVTDFRGHPERLSLNSPAEVVETEHRLVIDFTDGGAPRETLAHTAELAFAARATSSFPGAFPPFRVTELDQVLAARGTHWPGRADFLARALPRHAAVNGAEQAVLIDGSVLANAPFRPAIEALRERPARRQIDRRFVFIDPSPGIKLGVRAIASEQPGFFQTIIGAVSELPRQQPIRDNLEAIAERSHRIDRMRAVIRSLRPQVEAQIEGLFGYTLFLDRPTATRLGHWRARAHAAAARNAGYAYAAYVHLKLASVIDSVADLLDRVGDEPGPAPTARLRRLVADAAPSGDTGAATADFLRDFDLGFRIRRLRLLSRRISELEVDEDETGLAAMREAVYESLGNYLEAGRSEPHAGLRRAVRSLRSDAAPLLARLAAQLDLRRLDLETDARLAAAFTGARREILRPLLLTYLGFPFFDAATLPLLQGEGLDEFDPVKVDRISPDDATSIRGGGAEATLKGIQFNSFGAFFSRAYRENDYLWGRLHGAERLIDILLSSLPPGARLKPGRLAAAKRAAFRAILDEEEPKLTAIPGLVESLRKEIG
ncbi:patatin-like protein [Sphingomonas aracearum]|uniref:Patatin-like protein n=1 Tax=Sphingomonas aracearum TaxID=2283317 RepID=A0A369VU76_9SPHN|nr:patatin-like protein [Sphingomonas aracearum]RDE05087.1 patatin-like protein [Sphingomonas aracearum]